MYIETRRKTQCMQSEVNAIKRTGDYTGTRNIFYQIIKINETQTLLKYFFGARGVTFLEKRRENVQIFQALRWRFDIWEAILAVKNDGMSARNSYMQM